jgi:hypothetical protein
MQTWHYILIFIALIWLFSKSRKLAGHRKVISRRVTVKYFDHNPDFESILPVTGTVSRPIQVNNTGFFVIDLDEPFEYEATVYQAIIVRERVAGQILGYDNATDVHILLPKVPLDKVRYAFEDFEQVAWGKVEPLEIARR